MKNLFAFIFITLIISPFSSYAQIGIGMRDSHYINISYTFKKHYSVKLEQSIYAEKIQCQYLRGYIKYESNVGVFNYGVSPFFGHTYNSNYWNTGAFVDLSYQYKRLEVNGIVNPLYDSSFGYSTCFLLGAAVKIHGPLSLCTDYTTIPQYRMSEKRIRGGLRFNFDRFSFEPKLSIPVEGNGKGKSIRVDFSFNYLF